MPKNLTASEKLAEKPSAAPKKLAAQADNSPSFLNQPPPMIIEDEAPYLTRAGARPK